MSHEWIIQSCIYNKLLQKTNFKIPAGWSYIDKQFKYWTIGRGLAYRISKLPFSRKVIIIGSNEKKFTDFWTRVCRSAGAIIRIVKTMSDLTITTNGYMLTHDEFSPDILSKAKHFEIPIVSTTWILECLISGKFCKLELHDKLLQLAHQNDDE